MSGCAGYLTQSPYECAFLPSISIASINATVYAKKNRLAVCSLHSYYHNDGTSSFNAQATTAV
eukprot:5675026-Pleurochrysis_carterae.AAC.3